MRSSEGEKPTMRRSTSGARAGLLARCTFVVVLSCPMSVRSASLIGLGDLPGGDFDSGAQAISADGSVVVGVSYSSSGPEAFRWTSTTGMTGLGDLPGGVFGSDATAASSDGSVIVGEGNAIPSSADAFLWTSTAGMSALGFPGTANGVSGDGSIVVGSSMGYEAVRWSALEGVVPISGALGAEGISADGNVVVGYRSGSPYEAIRWTAGTAVGLGTQGTGNSVARDVSADGSVVVGLYGQGPCCTVAFRWTEATGMVDLGLPPGGALPTFAHAVSADGSVVVGYMGEPGTRVATIYDDVHGMRLLTTALTDLGVDLGGWQLIEATGISADGTRIVGRGIDASGDPEAFLANLTPTPRCSDGADNDGDGLVDYPADPGCGSPNDDSENPACDDGIDNDGDGLKDLADPGCGNQAWRRTENPACSDGVDDDGDGKIDWPADDGCRDATDQSEAPDCADGIDNDGDGLIDYPADPGCQNYSWATENPGCSDGEDNDRDGKIDFDGGASANHGVAIGVADPQCSKPYQNRETAPCGLGAELIGMIVVLRRLRRMGAGRPA